MWLFKNLMQLIVFFPFFFWKKQFINQIFLADPLILTGVFLAQIDQGAGNFLWDFGPYSFDSSTLLLLVVIIQLLYWIKIWWLCLCGFS